jgi:hypothetical protein
MIGDNFHRFQSYEEAIASTRKFCPCGQQYCMHSQMSVSVGDSSDHMSQSTNQLMRSYLPALLYPSSFSHTDMRMYSHLHFHSSSYCMYLTIGSVTYPVLGARLCLEFCEINRKNCNRIYFHHLEPPRRKTTKAVE